MRAIRKYGLIIPACATLALAPLSAPAFAQPVVQRLPSLDSQRLTQALARLGKDPRDIGALIDAGDAASGLGDYDAAIGFYQRADQISAGNPRVKAGLAKALVLSGDPVASLPVFADAERLGAAASTIASSRGLAHDLVGDNVAAQKYYKMVLGGADDTEVRMRLAISQAISGDGAGSETTLMPLLRKQDKPSWRTRAFALAIAGDTKQAVDITNSMLPPRLAESIAPYLRYMPRLTHAQQAAAANLGKFPRASEIGQDDPKIAAWVAANPVARLATADAGLIPKGEPLGKKGAKGKVAAKTVTKADKPAAASSAVAIGKPIRTASVEPPRIAPPEPKPTIVRDDEGELPPVAATPVTIPAQPAATPPVRIATAATVSSPPPAMAAAPVPSPAARTPSPGFDLARLPSSQTVDPSGAAVRGTSPVTASVSAAPPTANPASAPPPASLAVATPPPAQTAPVPPPATPEPSRAVSLLDAFADLGAPTLQAVPKEGAVDVTKIEPTKPAAKPVPAAADVKKPDAKAAVKKPVPPSHPSRIWVQIGVGRDKAAIAFDWKRMEKQAPTLFKGRKPSISEMGRTNRILVGPFETQKAASDFLAQAKKADIDGAFIWTSPAGQVVDGLAVK